MLAVLPGVVRDEVAIEAGVSEGVQMAREDVLVVDRADGVGQDEPVRGSEPVQDAQVDQAQGEITSCRVR